MPKTRPRPPLAERLKEGLNDVLRHVKGEIELRTTVVEIPDPPPTYKPKHVIRLRRELNMSQSLFAAVLGVSIKTVQSWEQGERNPSHAAARLLQAIEKPEQFVDFLKSHRQRITA